MMRDHLDEQFESYLTRDDDALLGDFSKRIPLIRMLKLDGS